jgi:hypothetical protein
MSQSSVDTTGRPAWLIPAAAFLFFCISFGMMYLFLRQDKEQIGPAFAKTITDPAGNMTIVPAGPFPFGSPPQDVILPSFYIDDRPVTRRAWDAFAQATRHPQPEGVTASAPDEAVRGVSYDDARAFAAWAQKRLPDAREREKARQKLALADRIPEWLAPGPGGGKPEMRGGTGAAGFRCVRDPH